MIDYEWAYLLDSDHERRELARGTYLAHVAGPQLPHKRRSLCALI